MSVATRRQMLWAAGGLCAGLASGALYRTRAQAKATTDLLRPPGAAPERDFLAACLRCGQCVQVCPFDTLKLAGVDSGGASGTPYLVARDVPCYLCQGYDEPLCIETCPTTSLSPVDDLRDIRMGIARIDESVCWAYNGTTCRACWHACPFPNEAIRYNERLRPVVDADHCVGCGLCEYACPTEPTSVRIEPVSSSSAAPAGDASP